MTEEEWIAGLRTLPLHPAARELLDDAALIDAGPLVMTTDTLVEGVHFLATDPPADVAWKLVATNLSDLAGKGAAVEGVLLNHPLSDDGWDRAFLGGLAAVFARFGVALIGGDTVSLPPRAPLVLTLTALGRNAAAPPRGGAQAGDDLWVTGTIGDAGAGLRLAIAGEAGADDAHGERVTPADLVGAYRRPWPRLAEGRALGPAAHAMMDVSDGLLIDAARMAAASGLAAVVDLAAVPLSPAYRSVAGEDRAARLVAATAGDDYQLLAALPPDAVPPVPATRIGWLHAGAGLALVDGDATVPSPARLGFVHAG